MSARVEWNGESRHIASPAELDQLLDEVIPRAVREPTMVELFLENGSSLAFGLGRHVTVLDYVPADLNPPYFQALGHASANEPLLFRFRGDTSEYPPEAAVPTDVGRAALRHFLVTGELTSELEWGKT